MNLTHNGLSGPLPATWRKNSTNFPSITSVLLFPGAAPARAPRRAAAVLAGRAACMQRPCLSAIRRALRWKRTALQ